MMLLHSCLRHLLQPCVPLTLTAQQCKVMPSSCTALHLPACSSTRATRPLTADEIIREKARKKRAAGAMGKGTGKCLAVGRPGRGLSACGRPETIAAHASCQRQLTAQHNGLLVATPLTIRSLP